MYILNGPVYPLDMIVVDSVALASPARFANGHRGASAFVGGGPPGVDGMLLNSGQHTRSKTFL